MILLEHLHRRTILTSSSPVTGKERDKRRGSNARSLVMNQLEDLTQMTQKNIPTSKPLGVNAVVVWLTEN